MALGGVRILCSQEKSRVDSRKKDLDTSAGPIQFLNTNRQMDSFKFVLPV